MKTGNVILAIFLWLCIPASVGIGFAFGVFTGNAMCLIGAPLFLFILGLIVLLTGMEQKPSSVPIRPKVIQQPIQSPGKAYCQMCGKPKGFVQFYLVTKDGKSLNVCEKCADEIEKKDKGINKNNLVNEDEVLKVLKLRYAKGEITKEQFEQMRKDLE